MILRRTEPDEKVFKEHLKVTSLHLRILFEEGQICRLAQVKKYPPLMKKVKSHFGDLSRKLLLKLESPKFSRQPNYQ
jgi:hypothetical protein